MTNSHNRSMARRAGRCPDVARSWVGVALLAAWWLAGVARDAQAGTQPPPAAPPANSKPIDAQLLEGLNDPVPPNAKTAPPNAPSAPAGEDAGAHPLVRLLTQMQSASHRLAERDSSPATQQIQLQVADELAKLIEQLRAQQQNQNQNSASASASRSTQETNPSDGENPTAPNSTTQSDRTNDQGPPKSTDEPPENVAVGKNVWGHLPPRIREQIQTSAIEEFLPKYRELIEAYYRRLAEQPAEDVRP